MRSLVQCSVVSYLGICGFGVAEGSEREADEANVTKKVSPHVWPHSIATQLLDAGAPLRAERRGASMPPKRAHFFAGVSQPLYALFHVVAQFILIAADRDTTGLVLRLRIRDHVTDALARMNRDAGVPKLPGSERGARLDCVFFDVAA